MHNCKDMCRYNSGYKNTYVYLQIKRCKIRGYVQNLHCRYKDVCRYKRGHCRTDQLFLTELWPTKIRHCEIRSFHMIILLQSSVQRSFNISLKTDVSHCCSFSSPYRGIWPPHFFFRKPHHWMVRIERCTRKGEKCCASIYCSLYFCTIKKRREKRKKCCVSIFFSLYFCTFKKSLFLHN